jgi:hypothetical protein
MIMGRRKHIPWKTKYASALLALGHVPYSDAKQMTEGQLISLYQLDHNILHETGDSQVDLFWNLTPMLIAAHKQKTREDITVIAKSRRIRAWNEPFMNAAVSAPKLRTGPGEIVPLLSAAPRAEASRPARTSRIGSRRYRKLRSRGFDKTLRKKMDGTVVKR